MCMSGQVVKLEKDLLVLTGRLSSAQFVEKAPQNVVASTTEKKNELAQQLKMVQDRLSNLR